MINFYPGPSKIYAHVGSLLPEAFDSGLLSMNHRSESFMSMMHFTLDTVKQKLDIPQDYEVFLVSSATESWEIIAQSFSDSFFHLYNGAFGQKWMEYTAKLNRQVAGLEFGFNEEPSFNFVDSLKPQDLVCLTHNETSNGSALPNTFLENLRTTIGNVIAVDATSSMAGVSLPWKSADIWFASVQKCFGLPAGLAVMVVSPYAISRAVEIGEDNHYNSFNFIRKNFQKWQTPYTPNILGIYLLGKSMESIATIEVISEEITARAHDLYSFFERIGLDFVVNQGNVQSKTVLALNMKEEPLSELKRLAKQHEILLGNGYGDWKSNSFRIANFPAISAMEIEQLKAFFEIHI